MPRFLCLCCVLSLALILSAFSATLHAMTGHEILEEIVKRNFQETFRVSISVKTMKGKKTVSKHSMWLMGRSVGKKGDFFLDFDQPKESKGFRILFRISEDQKTSAYMYLPATGKTLPLAVDDANKDVGGTGLTMSDFQAFMPRPGAKETLVGEETVDGRLCYVVKITHPDIEGSVRVWVSKADFLIVKSENRDPNEKVTRSFIVTKFFKTKQGKEYPREEEITVPGKNTRILLIQENAVFGIQMPKELTDPKTFGTFKWRL